MKSEAMHLIRIKKQKRLTKQLRGVSGNITVDAECNVKFSIDNDVTCVHRGCFVSDVPFPAPMLIGMDVLRCFNFERQVVPL